MEIVLEFTGVINLLQLPSVTSLYGLSDFTLNSPSHSPFNSDNSYIAGGMYFLTSHFQIRIFHKM